MPWWQLCPFPRTVAILLAFREATTVTKEFSKCHSRWWLCPFLEYWLLGSQDSHQRLLKMPPLADDAISWNSIYFSNRSNLAVEIHFLEFL